MKKPNDSTPYPRDPKSKPIDADIEDGCYVYVQDKHGVIHVLPDGPHLHPKVLGGGFPAMYAGDLTVSRTQIIDVTNLSGTFPFDDENGLRQVADKLRGLGFEVEVGAVRFFPIDGSRPRVLE